MKAVEWKKLLKSVDDDADVEVYDSDGNSWEIYGTHYSASKKLFRINLY